MTVEITTIPDEAIKDSREKINTNFDNVKTSVDLNDTHRGRTDNPHSVTLDQITPTTTKGDILVENGTTVTRLPAGTNTNVLAANSATATGLEWVPAGTPAAHKTSHQDGGADEIDLTGLTVGAGVVVGTQATQTLTNKSLTSPVLNGGLTGTAIKDEDNMASDSATAVPTQQSVKAYVLSIASQLNPVGTIREFNVATNPATLLGFGTWTAYGTGRVTVAIDSGQTEFDTVDETGGAKTHLLTAAESGVPAHSHPHGSSFNVNVSTATSPRLVGGTTGESTGNNTATNASSAHNNLQPYIVVYRWLRTA